MRDSDVGQKTSQQGKGGGFQSGSVPFGVSSREMPCGVDEISAATRHVGVACAKQAFWTDAWVRECSSRVGSGVRRGYP